MGSCRVVVVVVIRGVLPGSGSLRPAVRVGLTDLTDRASMKLTVSNFAALLFNLNPITCKVNNRCSVAPPR